jgi:hypothetical protein
MKAFLFISVAFYVTLCVLCDESASNNHQAGVEAKLEKKDDKMILEANPVDKEFKLVDLKAVNAPKLPIVQVDPAFDQNIEDKENTEPKEENNVARVQLPPIAPIMPFFAHLPPFVQSILNVKPLSSLNSNQPSIVSQDQEKKEQTNNLDASGDLSQKGHGILTVLMFKSMRGNEPSEAKNANSEAAAQQQQQQQPSGLLTRKLVVFKFMPNKLSSLFGSNNENSNSNMGPHFPSIFNKIFFPSHLFGGGGDDDVDVKQALKKTHLLGGGGENDPDRMRFKLMGNKDGDVDNQQEPKINGDSDEYTEREENIKTNDDADAAAQKDGFDFRFNFNRPENYNPSLIIRTDDGSQAFISNDIGQNRPLPQIKKCMMFSFMRMKASIYYRTIVHLMFITGMSLLILFLAIIMVRFYKRRQALRYYTANGGRISTIDVGLDTLKKTPPRGSFLFRTGSMKHNYAQKYMDDSSVKSSSLLISAPPAYEQIISNEANANKSASATSTVKSTSSLVNSLASAYKSRYDKTKLNDEDTKSQASLPAYDEVTKTNQI